MIIFIIIFFTGKMACYADDVIPKVKILGSDGKSEIKKVSWSHKISPLWHINQDGGQEFFWALQLELPGSSGILNIQAQNSEVGIRVGKDVLAPNNQTLFVGMRSLSDQILVTLKDNTHLEIKVDLLFKNPAILEEGCLANNIKISSQAEESKSNKPPAYLAYHCAPTSNGVILSVTAPKEAHWLSSSLFESKGKGKNWKNFEVSPQTIASGLTELGNFILEFNKVNFAYQITIEKTEIFRLISVFRLSLGMSSLRIQNGDVLDSTSKFSSYVLFEVRPWTPEFSFGGEGMTSLPTLTKGGFFNHTESLGYLGYTVYKNKNWSFEPRVYMYLAEGVSQKLQFYYIVSTFGIGGIFNFIMNSQNEVSLESLYMKTQEQSILSSRLFYLRKNLNKVGGWGLALIAQQSGMNLLNPKYGKSSQVYMGPFLEF